MTVRDWIHVAFPFAFLLTGCATEPVTSTARPSAAASAPELRDTPAPADSAWFAERLALPEPV